MSQAGEGHREAGAHPREAEGQVQQLERYYVLLKSEYVCLRGGIIRNRGSRKSFHAHLGIINMHNYIMVCANVYENNDGNEAPEM